MLIRHDRLPSSPILPHMCPLSDPYRPCSPHVSGCRLSLTTATVTEAKFSAQGGSVFHIPHCDTVSHDSRELSSLGAPFRCVRSCPPPNS
ncbi:hypothetical protein C8T65DRAFT_680373 [Cerioporus squamosus]|nr:hypothetical protein C8T65DRAFT_680373 [Cerioporus squamosus]